MIILLYNIYFCIILINSIFFYLILPYIQIKKRYICYELRGGDYIKYINLIKQTFIGCYLTKDEIKTALKGCDLSIKRFAKGQMLHLEGEECIKLEILLTGSIVSLQVDNCDNEHLIKTFQSNEIIAGNILFSTSPKYPLLFVAETNGELLQINKSFLFELFIKNPDILRQFLILISDRAISIGKKIKLERRKSLRNHIMEYLNAQSLFQNSTTVTLPISKTELANRFGVQRTSVSREFCRMEKEGLIKIYNNKTIEIIIDSILN